MRRPNTRSSRWCWCSVLLASFTWVARVGAGQLVLSPTNVDFGAVQGASTPIARTFRITNHGTPTRISGFDAIAGCADFSVSAPGLPKVIGDFDTLVVQVLFAPNDLDPHACAFEVRDDNGVSDILGLTGSTLAPRLSVFDTLLTYQAQAFPLGVPETLQVSLVNSGNQAIQAPHLTTALQNGSDFQVGTLPLPIPANQSRTLPIVFHPTRAGPKNDWLTISLDNDLPGDPDVVIHLKGTWYAYTAVGDRAIGEGNLQILPTPARGTVTIGFDAPRAGRATIEICDLAGRTVAHLERVVSNAGSVTATVRRGADWSPAPGVYLARVTLGGRPLGSKRLVVLR